MVLALADNLGAESSNGALAEELVVVLLDVNLLLDLTNSLGGNIASLFKAVSDLEGMDTLVEEFLGLVEEGASKDDDTGGSITDLIVLRLGELDEETSSLVLNLHLLNDCGTVIGNDNITVGADEHLVHSLGAKRGSHELGNGSCSQDVGLFEIISKYVAILMESRLLPADRHLCNFS